MPAWRGRLQQSTVQHDSTAADTLREVLELARLVTASGKNPGHGACMASSGQRWQAPSEPFAPIREFSAAATPFLPPLDAAPAVQSNCTATLVPCAIWRCAGLEQRSRSVCREGGWGLPSLLALPTCVARLIALGGAGVHTHAAPGAGGQLASSQVGVGKHHGVDGVWMQTRCCRG